MKICSFADLAVNPNIPAVFFYDAMHYGKPQPRAFSQFFGGEVGVEYFIDQRLINWRGGRFDSS